jgi:uncharacterized membrane protein HdeD (DUF308 family)
MNVLLARNWWAVLIRGVLAVVFGVLAFVNPGITLAALVLVFAAYSLVDGVFAVIAGLRAARRQERWWPFALEGLLSIVVGIIAFLIPVAAAFALLMLVSAWSIVTGLFRIAAAIRLRREIQGEWLLILSGILSVAFGVVIAIWPVVGLVTVMWLIGFYAVLFGVILIALAFRLLSHGARHPAPPARARQ